MCMLAISLHAIASHTTFLKLPIEEVVTLEKTLPAAELYNNCALLKLKGMEYNGNRALKLLQTALNKPRPDIRHFEREGKFYET